MSSSQQLTNPSTPSTRNNELTPFGFSQDLFNGDPFREMRSMHNFMNQAFNNSFRDFGSTSFANQLVLPSHRDLQPMRLDIIENPNEYVVRADVPGFTRENVKIEVDDGTRTLHISAENRSEREDHGEKDGYTYHRIERHSGNIYRSLRLPENSDANSITANVTDGVLNVKLPKRANVTETGRRRVNIV